MPNAAARVERFKALALGVGALPRVAHADAAARPRVLRSDDDADARRGRRRRHAAAAGVARVLVARVRRQRSARRPARQLRGVEEDPIDAAWLVEAIGRLDVRQRADRLDQIAFGQRVFGARRRRRARRRVRRGARAGALPHADVDARAHRHPRAVGLRRGRAPGGAHRRPRRPPRLRGAGAVSGRARDPRADGDGHARSTPRRRRR